MIDEQEDTELPFFEDELSVYGNPLVKTAGEDTLDYFDPDWHDLSDIASLKLYHIRYHRNSTYTFIHKETGEILRVKIFCDGWENSYGGSEYRRKLMCNFEQMLFDMVDGDSEPLDLEKFLSSKVWLL